MLLLWKWGADTSAVSRCVSRQLDAVSELVSRICFLDLLGRTVDRTR